MSWTNGRGPELNTDTLGVTIGKTMRMGMRIREGLLVMKGDVFIMMIATTTKPFR